MLMTGEAKGFTQKPVAVQPTNQPNHCIPSKKVISSVEIFNNLTHCIMNFKPEFEKTVQESTYESIMKYMVPLDQMITFRPEQSIQDAIDIIVEKKISGAPVLDERRHLVGNLSEKDCLRVIVDQAYHNMPVQSKTVADYMSTNVKSFPPSTNVVEAAIEFLSSPIRRYAVVDKGVLIGQVSRREILRAARSIKPTTW